MTLQQLKEEARKEFDRLFPNTSRMLKSNNTKSSNNDIDDNDAIWFHDWLEVAITKAYEEGKNSILKCEQCGADRTRIDTEQYVYGARKLCEKCLDEYNSL